MTPLENPTGDDVAGAPLALCYDDPGEFQGAFQRDIASGSLFVPVGDGYAQGDAVRVTLELPFCGARFELEGEVVAALDRSLARAASTTPGVSVRVLGDAAELQSRLEALTGLDLAAPGNDPGRDRRGAHRTRIDADIVLRTPDAELAGSTANICYTGVLAMLPFARIPVGTAVNVYLVNPVVELDLTVAGKIVHSRPCEGGDFAHGIQLHYPAERIDEVIAFIEFLQRFDGARRDGVVAGEIDASGLGSVLDMFVNTCRCGTLNVKRGKDEGKIVFSENYVLRCAMGMVTGMKALARMFQWKEGRFEFNHDLQLAGAQPDPQPVEAAMMMASVQVDEMARIGLDAFPADRSFEVASAREASDVGSLTELEREVLEFAADGFSVGAIADMVAAPDADIYKALTALVDRGTLTQRS